MKCWLIGALLIITIVALINVGALLIITTAQANHYIKKSERACYKTLTPI